MRVPKKFLGYRARCCLSFVDRLSGQYWHLMQMSNFPYLYWILQTSGIWRLTSRSKPGILGTKVNNMASRVKGLVCLWHHEHGRTYRSHDFSGGGRSRVLVSWRSTRDATSRRRVPWLATPCYLLSFPIQAEGWSMGQFYPVWLRRVNNCAKRISFLPKRRIFPVMRCTATNTRVVKSIFLTNNFAQPTFSLLKVV